MYDNKLDFLDLINTKIQYYFITNFEQYNYYLILIMLVYSSSYSIKIIDIFSNL